MAVARLPPIASLQQRGISPRMAQRNEREGPSYTLGKTQMRYNLPNPETLKPNQDTKSGRLETWPAHATGQAISSTALCLTENKQLVLVDDDAGGKSHIVPKPKFLDQLETFLKKELEALGVSDVAPSDVRLQAFREVFEYLIEDFKTYKPLLSAIKNEYEMMLSFQREHIRQMEPLKQMLVTVSEQCDQKIMALRDQEKQDMLDMKAENRRLYNKIDGLRHEQVDLETQVEKLQEELAAEYQRYRDESDARKMLISDINDLKYQQEDTLMSKQSMEELEEEKDDPVMLRIALKKAREDESAASKKLNMMVANYGDVIPRRDFEALQKQYQEMEEKIDVMKKDFQTLNEEHEALLDVHRQVLQQRDEYYVERESLRRNATPRPQWERCADYVAGGMQRWEEISQNKTSDQLVDVLLNEISGGAGGEAGAAEYFDGLGTGLEVPPYLRSEGKIRNRRLGKRDCALLIKDIWKEKMVHDSQQEDGKREPISSYLHTYLQRHFSLEQLVIEWGYNLKDACTRYLHDDNIGLFWMILNGEANEELYHNQLMLISKLLADLTRIDMDKGSAGSLTKQDFIVTLKEFFPQHEEENILSLVSVAERELEAKESDTLEYKNLFMEDDEGKTGPFLDEVKKIFKQDRLQYVEDIAANLGSDEMVSVDDLKKAITSTDPEIDMAKLDEYLVWAFQVTQKADLDDIESKDLFVIKQRLQNGNIRRVGKKQ